MLKTEYVDRLEQSRAFATETARLLAETHCHEVLLLDVTGISPITDFLIIATGTSARQMRGVMKQVEELGLEHDYSPLAKSGYDGETWLLCDMVDLVVHLFDQDSRLFYDLENLWGDAKRINWKQTKSK